MAQKIERPKPRKITCPNCRGTRKVSYRDGTTRTCPACDGTGKVETT